MKMMEFFEEIMFIMLLILIKILRIMIVLQQLYMSVLQMYYKLFIIKKVEKIVK